MVLMIRNMQRPDYPVTKYLVNICAYFGTFCKFTAHPARLHIYFGASLHKAAMHLARISHIFRRMLRDSNMTVHLCTVLPANMQYRKEWVHTDRCRLGGNAPPTAILNRIDHTCFAHVGIRSFPRSRRREGPDAVQTT